MTKTIKIQKGWFRTAGQMYGWALHGYDILGIGITKDALFGTEELVVEVNGKRYAVDCKEAIEFVRKYHSRQVMPGGTVLGVISRSLLKPL